MTVYCDLTREPDCVGILPDPGTRLVLTGTRLHTEPEAYRDLPLAVRLERECDVRFWFGNAPEPPFYTVPRSTVFARDSRGGYFLCGEGPALDWSEPVYYIDRGFACHRLTPVGEGLADGGMSWRETMVPSAEFEIFPDRAAAQKRYPIRSMQELLEENT